MYDLKKFSDLEQLIIKAFEKDEFKNNGVRETCRRLSKKCEHSASTIKNSYVYMNKYGLFEHIFPDRFKEKVSVVTLKMKESNSKKIDELVALANSKSGIKVKKQEVINTIIETAYEVMK